LRGCGREKGKKKKNHVIHFQRGSSWVRLPSLKGGGTKREQNRNRTQTGELLLPNREEVQNFVHGQGIGKNTTGNLKKKGGDCGVLGRAKTGEKKKKKRPRDG